MPDDNILESSGTSDAPATGCKSAGVSTRTNKNVPYKVASFLMLQDVSTIVRKYFLSS